MNSHDFLVDKELDTALHPPSADDKALAGYLRSCVVTLASHIGPRNTRYPPALATAASWVETELRSLNFEVRRQCYTVDGNDCANIEAFLPGQSSSEPCLLVGAHYDTAGNSPGANDNASGIASLLALGRLLTQRPPRVPIRLVAFVNEEPPYFGTPNMGSVVYARSLRDTGIALSGAIVLDDVGFYSDEPDSQTSPPAISELMPSRGNFLAVIGNPESRSLAEQTAAAFRATGALHYLAAVLPPAGVPEICLADQTSFWSQGFQALMLTDTAPYRYAHYHTPEDTPEKLEYGRMAQVVRALAHLAAG